MKVVVLAAAFLTLAAALTLPAVADSNVGTVSATVSIKVISITVNPTSLDYGVMELNSSKTLSTPIDIKHTGTETQDIWIKGSNTDDWTLADEVGANAFRHRASKNLSSDFVELSTSYKGYWADLAPKVDGEQDVVVNAYFHLFTPTSSTSTAQQTTTVTVLAVESLASGFGSTPNP